MNVSTLLKEKREDILRIAREHGAYDVRVFGSVARGEAHDASDIDLLVKVGAHRSPWFPVGLIQDLEELLGRKIDVVTEDSIYWLLRRRILKEAKSL